MNGEIKPTSDALPGLLGPPDRAVHPRREDQGRPVSTNAAGGADSVELTRKAQQLLRLEEKLAEFPAVDSQRVDAIRTAIAEGSYRIDADLIAERLLASEAEQKDTRR